MNSYDPKAFESGGPSTASDDAVLADQRSERSQMMLDTVVNPQPAPVEDVDQGVEQALEKAVEQAYPGIEEVLKVLRAQLMQMAMIHLAKTKQSPFLSQDIQDAITEATRRLFGVPSEPIKPQS